MTLRPTTSKLLLVADARAGADDRHAVPVRRYRLARILPEYRAITSKTPATARA